VMRVRLGASIVSCRVTVSSWSRIRNMTTPICF
jgi:hypothetical protein